MALQKEAMVTSRTEAGRKRFVPALVLSVIFAQAGSIKALVVGTVVAFNTSTVGYVEWATGGADGTGDVQGVIYPNPVTITTVGEVAGSVMFKGEAHRDDLVSDGGTSGQLDTALAAARVLANGLVIRALADVKQ
jgi:hypothetical protein